ncbi:BCAM0308 family protein [Pseudomonas zhanjiangensis]|uniref:BCAM0308 family protein n=1 Tax=Pseudomonas zhanjiangensis TaxID=3239015 RepID=A0ABV3YY39_9PSED
MDKQQQSQKNQLYTTHHGDPYLKPPSSGSALCPQCGAVYQQGRWAWQDSPPAEAQSLACPACQRIADGEPAGTLQLSGDFLDEHRDEILNLIHNTEAAEKAQHALERLLKVSEEQGSVQVTTTGVHLANRIGHALSAAYKGRIEYSYSEDERHVGIHWHRD